MATDTPHRFRTTAKEKEFIKSVVLFLCGRPESVGTNNTPKKEIVPPIQNAHRIELLKKECAK